jgi:hypothetical protein
MRKLARKIALYALTALFALCLGVGGWSATLFTAKADGSALETEFTNGGQFTVSQYMGVAYEYVDGGSEAGLPAGYNGAVLKIADAGTAYVTLDFSAAKIKASTVKSIVVRAYSPDYTADDEFRTLNTGLVQYGAGAYNMSTWCDIPLNANSIADMTDANGYLSNITVGMRVKSGATAYYTYHG